MVSTEVVSKTVGSFVSVRNLAFDKLKVLNTTRVFFLKLIFKGLVFIG